MPLQIRQNSICHIKATDIITIHIAQYIERPIVSSEYVFAFTVIVGGRRSWVTDIECEQKDMEGYMECYRVM